MPIGVQDVLAGAGQQGHGHGRVVPGRRALAWIGQDLFQMAAPARRIGAGMVAGRELKVTGRVSWVDGQRRMYNPFYELLGSVSG